MAFHTPILGVLALFLVSVPLPQDEETPDRPPSIASELVRERRGLEDFPLAARVVEHTLENGWRFLILPREGAPVVAFETYIGVGSVDESPGETGLAHMFEHMAFKGSSRVGTLDWEKESAALEEIERKREELEEARTAQDAVAESLAEAAFEKAIADAAKFVNEEEFSRVLEEAGGASTLNASTSADETRYVVSLPSNQIELWCWMEAERFSNPVLREFYREREAVLEERSMIIESNPFGRLLEELQRAAFTTHPYHHPVIGLPDDIRRHSARDAREFFDRHYGARNLITAIVGDVDPESLIPLLDEVCGRVPAGPEPRRLEVVEPPQEKERRVGVAFPANPMMAMGWHVPALADEDSAAVEIAVSVLGAGRSSRLEKRLIRDDALATQVIVTSAWPGERYPTLALCICVPQAGVELEQLESAIVEELARLAKDGPGDEELAGVKRSARAELLRSMQRSEDLAAVLVRYAAKTGEWRNAFRRVGELEEVSKEDMQRVVAKYLGETSRTIVTLEAGDER